MTTWNVDPDSETPPSRQLVEIALDAIASAELSVGDQLPSVRRLAVEAMVNANTVSKAYRDLEGLGAVQGENGRGVFVTKDGVRVAREVRTRATLERFRRALHEALRAGHSTQDLKELLRDAEQERLSA